MGYLGGFLVTARQHGRKNKVTTQYSGGREHARGKNAHDVKIPKPERLHGRHVLNRYEDGMEKCIGCELCAGVCPAKCIYVRGADNPIDDPVSPGERYGFVYEINFLRCIHCDLCVEACPTEAITESKLFEFSFTNRRDAIYTKAELLVGDDGKPQQLPWEDWREGDDVLTSGWMRATSPSGSAAFEGDRVVVGRVGRGSSCCRSRLSPNETSPRPLRPRRIVRMTETVVFVVATLMVLGGAFGVILRHNPVHAALSLVLTLFGIAVHFTALQAHFLAAVQVIVYAGAIVVLFLFVIMLLGVDKAEDARGRPAPDPAHDRAHRRARNRRVGRDRGHRQPRHPGRPDPDLGSPRTTSRRWPGVCSPTASSRSSSRRSCS